MRNSIKRLSETMIVSLLTEPSASPNRIGRGLLGIGRRVWRETDRKNKHSTMRYRISCWRVILWASIVGSIALFVCDVSGVNNNGWRSLYGLYMAFSVLILTACLVTIVAAPEDAFEQKVLLSFMTLFIRWLIPSILIAFLLILCLAYSSNRFYIGLCGIFVFSVPLGLLHITQTDIWLSIPLVRYSRYLRPEKLKATFWVAIIIFCFAVIQEKCNSSSEDHKYVVIVVTIVSYIVGEFVAYARDRWNDGIDYQNNIIKDADAIIMDISNRVDIDSKELIEDLISLDDHLSEDVLHRRHQKHVIASDELRLFLLLYVGRIISNDIVFCENKSRKVIIFGSLLLSASADELLRSMNNYVYEDTKKKGREILGKNQEQCEKDLCEFLFALREHLIEERCSV